MKLEIGKTYAEWGDPDARRTITGRSRGNDNTYLAGARRYTIDGQRMCSNRALDLVEIPQRINKTDKYQHAGFPGVVARVGFIDLPGDFPVLSVDLNGNQYHRHRADGTYGAPGHRFDLVPFVAPAPEPLVIYANVYPDGMDGIYDTHEYANKYCVRNGRTAKFVEVPE